MKPRLIRMCIYPKDIPRITGKSEYSRREMILKIKKSLNKLEHQMVSLQEFCAFTGLPLEAVREFITD